MSLAFLGLGTNLGDRLDNLRQAVLALSGCGTVLAVSPIYETAPVGVTDQPAFLNMALKLETSLTPQQLLRAIKDMEVTLGRTQTIRWGPRLIDIDILLFDQVQLNEDHLHIPHPRLCERSFALTPLADVAGNHIHPTHNQTIAQLLARLPVDDGVRRFSGLPPTPGWGDAPDPL